MNIWRHWRFALASLLLNASTVGWAYGDATLSRIDDLLVRLEWSGQGPHSVKVVEQPDGMDAGKGRTFRLAADSSHAVIPIPAGQRFYLIVKPRGMAKPSVIAERLLPLQRGSNFRDLGGYAGANGKHVVWGRLYRSGAMPLLSESDYTYLGKLGLSSIVDLRSLDERQLAPDLLDDHTGALFVSNDYAMAPLLAAMNKPAGEPLYAGTEKRLAPQLRALFRILLRDDGATLFHCSAGQDRTGIAAALMLGALGVDRPTIIRDYHLSTASRRPQFEMPPIDPAAFPGNPIVALYAQSRDKPAGMAAEPLYTSDGRSHIAMFLDYIDAEYGGLDAYLKGQLGLGPNERARLRAIYLR